MHYLSCSRTVKRRSQALTRQSQMRAPPMKVPPMVCQAETQPMMMAAAKAAGKTKQPKTGVMESRVSEERHRASSIHPHMCTLHIRI